MPDHNSALDPRKFRDPHLTADGQERAVVALTHLRTLWFNTGSLCNITCVNCYMESSPKNDALAYMTLDEVRSYLDEIHQDGMQVEEIAFTGGEPFMNPDIIEMLSDVLARDFKALVLTNAMKPMLNKRAPLWRCISVTPAHCRSAFPSITLPASAMKIFAARTPGRR